MHLGFMIDSIYPDIW